MSIIVYKPPTRYKHSILPHGVLPVQTPEKEAPLDGVATVVEMPRSKYR